MTGSLVIAGCGIAGGQITSEAECEIRAADLVMYLLPFPLTAALITSWSRECVNLEDSYREGRPRSETYAEMAGRVLAEVQDGRHICLAMYGHAGVLNAVSQFVVRMAGEAGFPVRMLPGISAEACLYADLGIDPGENGMQSHVASRLLRQQKKWDPETPLILWQIGMVGDDDYHAKYSNSRLNELVDRLTAVYGPEHRAVIYEAATIPFMRFRADRVRLTDLTGANLRPISTLLIEPITPGGAT